jgi:hypothetical protein
MSVSIAYNVELKTSKRRHGVGSEGDRGRYAVSAHNTRRNGI